MLKKESAVLAQSRLSEPDKNIAKVLSGSMAEALAAMPEAAMLAGHVPALRMMVLRLAFELGVAAIDAALDVEASDATPNNNPVN